MRKTPIWAALDDGVHRIEMNVSMSRIDTPYFIDNNAIKGFWSTPTIKTALTESQIRNGSHGISHKVLYSSRVVTIPFAIRAKNRDELTKAKNTLSMFIGSPNVRFEMYNGLTENTYVEGMIAIEYSLDVDEKVGSGEITLTCIDAERKSIEEFSSLVGLSLSSTSGGLSFGEEHKGLVFPLNFGKREETRMQNVAILHNDGNYSADVRIYITGELNGVFFEWADSNGDNGDVEYTGYIGRGQTVLLNSKTDTATIGGTDFSGLLRSRNFPRIPANGDIRIIMTSYAPSGEDGYAEIKYNDTWM